MYIVYMYIIYIYVYIVKNNFIIFYFLKCASKFQIKLFPYITFLTETLLLINNVEIN